jgi:malate synthase
MSRYDPLRDHLMSLKAGRWRATFKEIEEILGLPLPFSARQHQAWWSNHQGTHVQSNAWLKAGFQTEELDLGSESITFVRR